MRTHTILSCTLHPYTFSYTHTHTHVHTQCNNTCGQGVQRRNVRCRNTAGKAADTFCCRGQPLPELTRECYDDRSAWCQPDWHSGTWEQVHNTQCNGILYHTHATSHTQKMKLYHAISLKKWSNLKIWSSIMQSLKIWSSTLGSFALCIR